VSLIYFFSQRRKSAKGILNNQSDKIQWHLMAAHQLHFTSLCLCVSASLREPHLFFLAKAQKRKGDFE